MTSNVRASGADEPRSPARSLVDDTRRLLKKTEVHKEKFDSDDEIRKEIRGYLTILGCNALSCASLLAYLANVIDARTELQCEAVFLVVKGLIEIATDKFGWQLLLHHTAMVGGFLLNQHPSMHCWAFITVHQQFVHFPFAVRALWRLTLPAFGFVKSELSWRRRGLINVFWVMWMFNCGYRSALIFVYSAFAALRHNWSWQPAVGVLIAMILGNLDRLWTKAMWPRVPWPNPRVNAWFQVGTRVWFVLGLIAAICAALTDTWPEALPESVRDPLVATLYTPLSSCT